MPYQSTSLLSSKLTAIPIASAMLLCLSLLALASSALCTATSLKISPSQVPLPKPTGLYQVGLSVTELIDYNRTQPFLQDYEPIKLMISVFYPVIHQHHSTMSAYMPPETASFEDLELSAAGLAAPNGTFEKLTLHVASNEPYENLGNQTTCQYPLVLFMPGEGTSRHFYNQIASTVASTGYIVVTVDAPYDVDVVEYPDGSLAIYNRTLWGTEDQIALNQTGYLAVETRSEDVSFVLDSLSNTNLAHSLIPNLPPSGLNTTHTAMFGHSLGGATAFSVLESDDRILGGLDMDGGLYGPGLLAGTSKPFMLMGHAGHTRGNENTDPFLTWETVWPLLTGWKRDIIVANTGHYEFTDYPIVFETLGITPRNETVLEMNILLGSMEGKRALDIVTSYAGAFLDYVIYGKCSALLEGPVKEFPEVTFEY